MIKLFHIKPQIIDTSKFNNLLHDGIVQQFEKEFCDYVGAKHACSTNSATSAIFLILKRLMPKQVSIPSVIPPVVVNTILNCNCFVRFTDDVDWVGSSYTLLECKDGSRVIDSAQRVDRDQFKNEAKDDDLMFFSFYPTKPVGSSDGGIIVSNNEDKIRWYKEATMNGMIFDNDSWRRELKFPGYKMYLSSIQAQMALHNLKRLDSKKNLLLQTRNYYNEQFCLNNTSDHLYRITVKNSDDFIHKMRSMGIVCGKHYDPAHKMNVYHFGRKFKCPKSEKVGETTVSIPFHEALTVKQIYQVVRAIKHETGSLPAPQQLERKQRSFSKPTKSKPRVHRDG